MNDLEHEAQPVRGVDPEVAADEGRHDAQAAHALTASSSVGDVVVGLRPDRVEEGGLEPVRVHALSLLLEHDPPGREDEDAGRDRDRLVEVVRREDDPGPVFAREPRGALAESAMPTADRGCGWARPAAGAADRRAERAPARGAPSFRRSTPPPGGRPPPRGRTSSSSCWVRAAASRRDIPARAAKKARFRRPLSLQ